MKVSAKNWTSLPSLSLSIFFSTIHSPPLFLLICEEWTMVWGSWIFFHPNFFQSLFSIPDSLTNFQLSTQTFPFSVHHPFPSLSFSILIILSPISQSILFYFLSISLQVVITNWIVQCMNSIFQCCLSTQSTSSFKYTLFVFLFLEFRSKSSSSALSPLIYSLCPEAHCLFHPHSKFLIAQKEASPLFQSFCSAIPGQRRRFLSVSSSLINYRDKLIKVQLNWFRTSTQQVVTTSTLSSLF